MRKQIDPVKRLRLLSAATSQSQVARDFGISAPYLCDLLAGRRDPGPKLLKAMGIVKEVIYRTADER